MHILHFYNVLSNENETNYEIVQINPLISAEFWIKICSELA